MVKSIAKKKSYVNKSVTNEVKSVQSYKSFIDDVNRSQDKRSCEFLIAEPSAINCIDIMEKLKIITILNNTDKNIKSITPEDIYKVIHNFPKDDKAQNFPYLPVMRKCLDEAREYSASNLAFPANFLAKFIQIIAIYYMYYDYELCKDEISECLKRENEKSYDNEIISLDSELSPSCEFIKNIKLKPKLADEIIVQDKHIIFVINNFFDVDLLKELIYLNLPLKCVIEVSDAIEGFERQCKCFRQRNLDEDVNLERRMIDYWLKMYEMFEGNVQYDYMENVFHTQYIPTVLKRTIKGTEDYEEQCLMVYEDFCDYLEHISPIDMLYTSYVNSMLNVNLGTCAKIDSVSLKVYNKVLDDLPPDCVTIASVMDALTLEVAKHVPEETEPNETLQSDDETMTCNDQCCDFRDEATRLFEYKKNKYDPKTITDLNDNGIDFATFEMNEANRLMLTFRPYKRIRDELLDLNAKYLCKMYPFSLWNKRNETGLLENYIRTYDEYKINFLGLTNEELNDSLNLFVLNDMYVNVRVLDVCPIEQLFPPVRYTLIYYKPETFNISNMYTRLNFIDYVWKENLTAIALMQKLLRDIDQYSDCVYYYCEHSNAYVIKLSDECDSFGCTTRDWFERIATPICLRDFCKYVIIDHRDWVTDVWYKHYEKVALLKDLIACRPNNFFDESVFENYDYILKGSFKDIMRQEEMKNNEIIEPTSTAEIKGKKGKKSKILNEEKSKEGDKEKSKKDKKKEESKKNKKENSSKKAVKSETTMKTVVNPLANYDKLIEEVEDTLKVKEPRYAHKGEPYEFVGYNFSNKCVQLNGNTTTFQSLDGLRTTIDTAKFIGELPKISVQISANNHKLFFHQDNLNLNNSSLDANEQFENFNGKNANCMVHFVLDDGTVVVFSKPMEAIVKEGEAHEENTRNDQTLYYVIERKKSTLNCFGIEYTRKKSYLLPEAEWRRYKKSMLYLGNGNYLKNKSKTHSLNLQSKHSQLKHLQPNSHNVKPYNQLVNVESTSALTQEELKEQFVKDLKRIRKESLPMFKVCSSKLHGRTYLSRVKSYITIPFEGVLRRIQYKPKLKAKKRIIEAKKCFLIEDKENTTNQPIYKINLSLPSSLCLSTEADEDSWYVKQHYLKKNQQYKNSAHEEEMRLFYPNGYVITKKNEKLIIFTNNGDAIYLDCPYVKDPRLQPEQIQQEIQNLREVRKLQEVKKKQQVKEWLEVGNQPDVKRRFKSEHSKYKKAIKQVLRRRLKHMIDGPEAYLHRTRHLYKKNLKRYFLPNRHYSFETSGKYTIVKRDGKMIKNINGKFTEEDRYYVAKDCSFVDFETIYHREDGTHILLVKDGSQHVQFPDGTRIHTYIQTKTLHHHQLDEDLEDPQTFCLAEDHTENVDVKTYVDDAIEECKCTFDKDSLESSILLEDWIIVDLIYEFNHPYYATIRLGTARNYVKITLPNDSSIEFLQDAIRFHVDDVVRADLNRDSITLRSTMCKNCNEGAKAILNVSPIYNNETIFNDTQLLIVTDTFDKKFEANYSGFCKRNDNYIQTDVNKYFCTNHVTIDTIKLYAINHDCSGTCYWNYNMYDKKRLKHEKEHNKSVQHCKSNVNSKEIVEFRTLNVRNPTDLFAIPYEYLDINLTEKLVKNNQCKYVSKTLLYALPESTKFEQLLQIKRWICDNLNEDVDSAKAMHAIEKCVKQLASNNEDEETSSATATEPIDMQPKPKYRDKLIAKKKEVDELKRLIKGNIVPNYFDSIYGKTYLNEQYLSKIDVKYLQENVVRIDKSTSTSDITFVYDNDVSSVDLDENVSSKASIVIVKEPPKTVQKIAANIKKNVAVRFNEKEPPQGEITSEKGEMVNKKSSQNLEDLYNFYAKDKDRKSFNKNHWPIVLQPKNYVNYMKVLHPKKIPKKKDEDIEHSFVEDAQYSQSAASMKTNFSLVSLENRSTASKVTKLEEKQFHVRDLNLMKDTSKMRVKHPCRDIILMNIMRKYLKIVEKYNKEEMHEEEEKNPDDYIEVTSRGMITDQ